MPELRFKSCSNCTKNRAWNTDRCPNCGESDFDTVIENGDHLVEKAIGDSINETILFDEDIPLTALPGTPLMMKPGALVKEKATETSVLNNSVSDYLQPNENPHFFLQTDWPIKRERQDEVSKLAPTTNFHSAYVLITSKRILFLVGQEHGDLIKQVEYSEMIDLTESAGLSTPVKAIKSLRDVNVRGRDMNINMSSIQHAISIEAEEVTYTFFDCTPLREKNPAIAYMNAQYGEDDFDWGKYVGENDSRSKRALIENILNEVDPKHAASLGVKGLRVGARSGPKGAAVGFVIGIGFSIWSSVSNTDSSSSEAPSPENMADNIKEWQRAGIQTGNEKAEWLSCSTGAAVTFAAHNSDNELVQQLENIDPELLAKSLQAGAEVMGDSNLPAINTNSIDTIPEIDNIRLPVFELTSLSRELFEEGLFQELIEKEKELQ